MGLCKCPKKRVTNQFCFEHRVNVCEYCMVTNHPICIVQSYIQWLQDSDYNSICEICSKDLHIEDSIRLTCYHVFHWSCLDQLSRQLPPTTAPAGYTCPSCRHPLFPPPNLISPVADVLKEKLAGVNWARAGLGLPLLSEEREIKPTINHVSAPPSSTAHTTSGPHSVVDVEDPFSRGAGDGFQPQARRVFQDIRETRGNTFDRDEDKYKRRPASEWVKRLWKNAINAPPRTRTASSIYKRYCMLGLILVFGIVVFFLIMSRLGRYSTEDDPSFDPMQNPHIHIQQQRSM